MKQSEKTLWKTWADNLRQDMMGNLIPEVTKSVKTITAETATTRSEKSLHSTRFWESCQSGQSPNDTLAKAGFEIDFQPENDKKVHEVTLRLNQSWKDIQDRVIARKRT